jgi:uncharacterized membrane protein YgcG
MIPNNATIFVLIALPLLLFGAITLIVWALVFKVDRKRQAFIEQYVFTPHQYSRVQIAYPHLTDGHLNLLSRGLKTFFLAHLQQPNVVFAMPSKAVDALWHAFILDTRAYQSFCHQAFGHYFHHIPGSRMVQASENEASMERMWRFACQSQGLRPTSAVSLAALFALDSALEIPDGFKHDVNHLVKLSKAHDLRQSAGSDGGSIGGSDGADGGSCASSCGGGGGGCGGGCGGD